MRHSDWSKRVFAQTLGVNRYDSRLMRITSVKLRRGDDSWSYTIKGYANKEWLFSIWGFNSLRAIQKDMSGHSSGGPGQPWKEQSVKLGHKNSQSLSVDIFAHGGLDI